MIGRIREAARRRPLFGAAISLAVHVALLLALFGVPALREPLPKRGDALIVELPNVDEPAMRGTPGPDAETPKAQVPPAPTPPAPKTPPTPKAPPTPKVAAAPRPPAPPPAARAEARDVPRTPPQPAPSVEQGDTPTAKSAPQPPEAVAKAPEPERQETATAPASPTPPGPVAMVPPARPDFLSTFRRNPGGLGQGGAGGTGVGRGGIVGDPIPLDSKDRDLSDYLERIKRQIYQHWAYPCVKDQDTRACDHKTAQLVVEFGILRHGGVQYVEVRRRAEWRIYDEYAVRAIQLASPFPPVPQAMMARMHTGSTGASILARFTYVVDTGLTNVLR